MRRILLPLSLLLAAAPLSASGEAPFVPSGQTFADAAGCKAHLGLVVADARAGSYAAVEGPYEIAAGDVRAHLVLAEEAGHRITEHRCLAEKLSSRTWRHSMGGEDAEAPETIDSMAAKAEWLKKPAPKR